MRRDWHTFCWVVVVALAWAHGANMWTAAGVLQGLTAWIGSSRR